jgi:hypothetical protein
MNDAFSEKSMAVDLGESSRKTGLVVRFPDSSALTDLFARLAQYDADERAETFDYLTHALNETRAAHGRNLRSISPTPTASPRNLPTDLI